MEPNATTASVALLALVVAAVPGSVFAQGKTQKLSQKLVEKADHTLERIEETDKQLRRLMEKLNGMLAKSSVEDRRDRYGDVKGEADRLEERAKELREASREMEAEASQYFAEWSRGLEKIQDADLRALSQSRLNETQAGYSGIVAAGRQGADRYDTFVTEVRDQLRYLSLDMSDDAVRKLQSGGRNLKGLAADLSRAIAEIKRNIREYIRALS